MSLKEVIVGLRALQELPPSHPPCRPHHHLEGQIWLTANPQADWKERKAQDNYGRGGMVYVLEDISGGLRFGFPLYLTDVAEVWKLWRAIAPDMGLRGHYRPDGLLEIVEVYGAFGRVHAEFTPLPPTQGLLLAIFEYLLAKWRIDHTRKPRQRRLTAPRNVPAGGIW